MRLELFISELLFDHDCVIVPDFGGFVATYRPARLNAEAHLIHPPTKHVGFNRHLSHNDGLLIDHIARQTGLAYNDAARQVADHVRSCKQELQSGGRFVWQKVGVFFNDAAGQLQFIPDDQQNFLQEAYGWPSIQLLPAQRLAPAETPLTPTEITPRSKDQSIWWKAAAVMLPIGIAGTLLVTGWARKNANFHMADLNPFARTQVVASYPQTQPQTEEEWKEKTTSPLQTAQQEGATEVKYDFSGDSLSAGGIGVVFRTPAPQKAASSASPNMRSGDGKYEIIGGAFMFEDNADKLVQQLKSKGFNARRVGTSKGLFLVAFGTYPTSSEATRALQTIRASENKNAWMRIR
jgi:hypothetical protein